MGDTRVAVVTICRDDEVLLRRFVDYYGGLFGRRAIYIISHGDTDMVRDVAAGCSIVPVPEFETDRFTMLHWRTKNHLKDALRQWYHHVIVVDVDEFVVIDPATGLDLRQWLETARQRTVYTAFGFEIVHRRSEEPDGIADGILGPRRHAQVALWYAKPCILSRGVKLSRGGHFADHPKLDMPDELYLFHMKYCDWSLFVDTANRRNAFIAEQQRAGSGTVRTNPQWFADKRRDEETFAAFEARPVREDFDLAPIREAMRASWRERSHGLYHFDRIEVPELFKLPERFSGADVV
ncbi:hypothetical protein ROJ8625_02266 [Roseivivax jejudonensis]|uniref:Glycosyl transferase family 2 n=1 Tax=Roseivivax jejudonensis TaxID=1529041 RepID=A0A1X6ZC97_9RHOB|nr:glycosyltransferase family 2 protein [Roseivivax jejudonensis]SLN46804.1 hypothetical protein ROJ8625_02266 [Roseivivax jejudonensis]